MKIIKNLKKGKGLYLLLALLTISCGRTITEKKENKEIGLYKKIINDPDLKVVEEKALHVVKDGFNAGAGYMEVWIRDYNTFITLAAEVHDKEILKENLRVFLRLQGEDGNIVDGFIPKEKVVNNGYDYIFTDLETDYAGHKNTVETDQESSLIQAIYRYIGSTGDKEFLNEKIGEFTVKSRMENAMDFLMSDRYNEKYGLLWGATTADWGDVQPEHEWGVYLTDDTHYAIDIYDNAMFIIALNNLIELVPEVAGKWKPIRDSIADNSMEHLWDESNQKFIPHIYLKGSPFPDDFNENEIYYHGGTAMAIQAGLLSKAQIRTSLDKMVENVEKSGAPSIGLTLYPPYPAGFFRNEGMYPYGYQNGGDWTWFGGRLINVLIDHGFIREAYEQVKPMLARVIENDGFYEWYTIDNKPMGSATFKGSAGVLYEAIVNLRTEIKAK